MYVVNVYFNFLIELCIGSLAMGEWENRDNAYDEYETYLRVCWKKNYH